MSANVAVNQFEKRSFRRVSDAIALVVIPEQDERAANLAEQLPIHPTHVVSLSGSGMRFYHPEPYDVGERLQTAIRLFPSGQTIEVVAEVVNAGEAPGATKTLRYFTGIAFRDIRDEDQAILLAHLESVAAKAFSGVVKLVN